MHALKVTLLLLLTLAVMRLLSWSVGWVLFQRLKVARRGAALGANAAALGVFAGFLVTQRIPGELIDASALTFGVVVFSLYALFDLRWTRWGRGSQQRS